MMRLTLPAGSAAARASAQSGITLLEMLVVISIIGLVTAALPLRNFTALNTVELRTTARAIAADLRAAQQVARASNTSVWVAFDVKARRLGSDIHLDDDIAISFETSLEDMSPGQNSNGAPSEGRVIFWPDGSSNGGRIALSRAGTTMTITTHWLTGLVEVRREG